VHERPIALGGSRPFLNIEASPRVADFYPSSARARREQGAVSMQVCSSPSGDLTNGPEVLQSSGSARLDEAAQAWARAARWIPATRDNKAVGGCTKISVLFQAPA
jgi:TonB family protein